MSFAPVSIGMAVRIVEQRYDGLAYGRSSNGRNPLVLLVAGTGITAIFTGAHDPAKRSERPAGLGEVGATKTECGPDGTAAPVAGGPPCGHSRRPNGLARGWRHLARP